MKGSTGISSAAGAVRNLFGGCFHWLACVSDPLPRPSMGPKVFPPPRLSELLASSFSSPRERHPTRHSRTWLNRAENVRYRLVPRPCRRNACPASPRVGRRTPAPPALPLPVPPERPRTARLDSDRAQPWSLLRPRPMRLLRPRNSARRSQVWAFQSARGISSGARRPPEREMVAGSLLWLAARTPAGPAVPPPPLRHFARWTWPAAP